jgi:hypothetical protein
MKFQIVLAAVSLGGCSVVLADDDCQRQADFVLDMVAAKPGVLVAVEEARKDNRTVEAWQYQLLVNGESLTELGVSSEKQEEMAKSITSLNYSDNPEVEVNIFEDYFFLTCEMEKRGEAYRPLREISENALLQCWETVASREEFQECLAPLIQAPTGDRRSD